MKLFLIFFSFLAVSSVGCTKTNELKTNEDAPLFSLQKHDGTTFDLKSRKGAGQWTVLYFYPKAGTPGCTKQACAFRDGLDKIKALGASVYGISADTVEDQMKFHKEHKLNFDLLADPEGKVVTLYGSSMIGTKFSKRWTFVLDPDLKIRDIMKDVDPVMDSTRVAQVIADLQKKK
jgi:thioredoxin-dependent peroxiredoxin